MGRFKHDREQALGEVFAQVEQGDVDAVVESEGQRACWCDLVVVEGVDQVVDCFVAGCGSISDEKSVLSFIFVHILILHDAGFSLWLWRGMSREFAAVFPQELNNPQYLRETN